VLVLDPGYAVCQGCVPVELRTFPTAAARDEWVTLHIAETGHSAFLAPTPPPQHPLAEALAAAERLAAGHGHTRDVGACPWCAEEAPAPRLWFRHCPACHQDGPDDDRWRCDTLRVVEALRAAAAQVPVLEPADPRAR
jgi:hypothetical protein